jgi:hypothetical protein
MFDIEDIDEVQSLRLSPEGISLEVSDARPCVRVAFMYVMWMVSDIQISSPKHHHAGVIVLQGLDVFGDGQVEPHSSAILSVVKLAGALHIRVDQDEVVVVRSHYSPVPIGLLTSDATDDAACSTA